MKDALFSPSKRFKLLGRYCEERSGLLYFQTVAKFTIISGNKKKNDVFAMIRQLGLPACFLSLSSADTRLVDLLKMLAKLNNNVEYSDKQIEEMTLEQKSKPI